MVGNLPAGAWMPDRSSWNSAEQKSPQATSGLTVTPSRCTPLHNNRDGVLINAISGSFPYDNPNTLDSLQSPRPLRIFLCHSSGDKPIVRELYKRLKVIKGIVPWLDEEDLLPGQDWQYEIRNAVRNNDIVIICLSKISINKVGYVHKEIKFALDLADEQPEGTIFLIPLRLEECNIPIRLTHLHWVNYFEDRGFNKLIKALDVRANSLK
jgi:hypothetical protein